MKAVIVAAGRGSRLRPHTDTAPKCLLPFAGRRLVDWQISALRSNGIADIGIVGGYKVEALADLGLQIWENARWHETNMVYSLLRAREVLESGVDIIVSYGDIVYEPRVLAALLATEGDIAVVVDRNWEALWTLRHEDPLGDAESLKMSPEGRLLEIGRKIDSLAEAEAQYIGLIRLSAEGARRLVNFYDAAAPDGAWLMGRTRETCYMTDLLRGMIEAGDVLVAAPVDGGWLEFDTGEDIEAYKRLLADGGLDRFFRPWME